MTNPYVLECIRKWVWAGYHDEAAVRRMVRDILEADDDVSALHDAIAAEFLMKAQAEASWPQVTDCDRLDSAFIRLAHEGVCVAQSAGYELSDGYAEIAEALHHHGRETYQGYCFFHGGDVESALKGNGLWIAFGDLDDDESASAAVGRRVFGALVEAGLHPEWNGAPQQRIKLPTIDWKRRY